MGHSFKQSRRYLERVSGTTNRGRAAAENVFLERLGPTSYSQRGVKSDSPLSAFRLFVDEPMLRSILKFPIKHGQADDASSSVDLRELEKFIGLQIARGVLVGKTPQFINCGVENGVTQSLPTQ